VAGRVGERGEKYGRLKWEVHGDGGWETLREKRGLRGRGENGVVEWEKTVGVKGGCL